MHTRLLDLLACPACLPAEEPLTPSAGAKVRGDDIVSGTLECGRCGAAYLITDGLATLLPPGIAVPPAQAKYDTDPVLGSYLWSSFGDLLSEPGASDAYARWAAMLPPGDGPALDAGCAVGRSTLELAAVRGFAVGLDLAEGFMRAARTLHREGRIHCRLKEQGALTKPFEVALPPPLREAQAEFVVADAMALPFRQGAFACGASLNVVDKLPDPLAHLRELDRVLRPEDAQLLLADPFSWSEDIAPPQRWLGGVEEGPLAGRSEEVLTELLSGKGEYVRKPFGVQGPVAVSWVIRNHANHSEHIVSQTFKAVR